MAIAYSKVDQKNLNNAVAKAKQVKPLVKPLDFGKFEVTGSKGETYIVEFYKEAGEFIFSCTCPGHKRDLVCYHCVACSSIFKKQVADRAAEKAAPALEALPEGPKCLCGNEAFTYHEGKWTCGECLKKRQERWAHWDEVEAKEEAAIEAPAPVEEKFTCFKRGCTVEVDERDCFCESCALEVAAAYDDLFN